VQPHPGKIAAKSVETVKITREEIKERSRELPMAYTLIVYLEGNHGKNAENKRNHQALKTFPQIRPVLLFGTQTVICTYA